MALKKFGDLLQEYTFDTIQHELTAELKVDAHIVNLCKVLFEGLKGVGFVPSQLQYALISEENEETGQVKDKVVAFAEFMEHTISIHDLEPAEIVSTNVDLDDQELETLFIAICLATLSQDDDEEDMDLINEKPSIEFEEELTIKLREKVELGEKEYDEQSLFPFKTPSSDDNLKE